MEIVLINLQKLLSQPSPAPAIRLSWQIQVSFRASQRCVFRVDLSADHESALAALLLLRSARMDLAIADLLAENSLQKRRCAKLTSEWRQAERRRRLV